MSTKKTLKKAVGHVTVGAIARNLERFGATDRILEAPVLGVIRVTERLRPCTVACRVGRRLDCVLAHLADGHGWSNVELAAYAREKGVV